MKKYQKPAVLGILLGAMLACSLVPQIGAPTPEQKGVESAPAATLPAATATQTPLPLPSATPTDSSPVCVPAGQAASLTNAGYDAYPVMIQDYLNAGATASQLESALQDAAVANRPKAVMGGDLNADGKTDVAVSIFNPASSLMPPDSTLAIYLCEAGAYHLAYQQSEASGAILWHFRDLDADGADELIISRSQCGAHTCFEAFHIISGQGGNIQDTLLAGSDELPYPTLALQDPDGDRRFDLLITGSGFGSVGAGPQRPKTVVYSYDPDQSTWVRSDTILGDSNYRIHILHDAETAAREGDYAAAIGLYQRVIEDPTLEDWQNPAKEQADLSAYAGFKLVVMYTLLDQADAAKNSYNSLNERVPRTAPQNAYVVMSQEFLQAYSAGGVMAACQAVEANAEANVDAVLLPLNSFGYGNPGYTAADICPYR